MLMFLLTLLLNQMGLGLNNKTNWKPYYIFADVTAEYCDSTKFNFTKKHVRILISCKISFHILIKDCRKPNDIH